MTASSTGINGMNVRINGVSRDQVMAAHGLVGGGFMLIQNNAELVPMARAAGIQTIYRQSGDGGIPDTPDDDILCEWVEHFVAERAAKGADYVHLFNEIEDSPRLHLATEYALDYAIAHKLKLAIYNYGTNAKRSGFENARANIQRAIAHGMIIGIHVYLELGEEHREGAFEWLPIKHELGGLWVATEFNFIRSIFDAERGPRNYLGAQARITWEQFAERFTPFFATENIPLCWFSFDDWPDGDQQKKDNGFGYWNALDFQKKLGLLNQIQVIKEVKPVPSIPDRNSLGAPIAVMVTKTVASNANIRSAPNRSSDVLGTFKVGDTITIHPKHTNLLDDYLWYAVEAPKVGWSANVFDYAPVETPTSPVWTVNLDAPYVSQIDGSSSLSNNDCGIASLLMLERYWLEQHGLSTPLIPSVDDVTRRSPLAQPNPPKGLTFAQIQQLALLTGFQTHYDQPMTEAKLIGYLNAQTPVAVLLDYSVFNPLSKPLSHILVVYGFNDTAFLTHDPFSLGQEVSIPRATLMRAMASSPGNSVGFQAMVLA